MLPSNSLGRTILKYWGRGGIDLPEILSTELLMWSYEMLIRDFTERNPLGSIVNSLGPLVPLNYGEVWIINSPALNFVLYAISFLNTDQIFKRYTEAGVVLLALPQRLSLFRMLWHLRPTKSPVAHPSFPSSSSLSLSYPYSYLSLACLASWVVGWCPLTPPSSFPSFSARLSCLISCPANALSTFY